MDGEESNQLILKYADQTKREDVYFVPHVVLNDVDNRTLERHIREDFLSTICDLLTDKPKICSNRFYDMN